MGAGVAVGSIGIGDDVAVGAGVDVGCIGEVAVGVGSAGTGVPIGWSGRDVGDGSAVAVGGSAALVGVTATGVAVGFATVVEVAVGEATEVADSSLADRTVGVGGSALPVGATDSVSGEHATANNIQRTPIATNLLSTCRPSTDSSAPIATLSRTERAG